MSLAPRLVIFRSESNARLFGYTFEADGSNLPSHLGPWQVFDGMLTPGIDIATISVIKRAGFFLREQRSNIVPLRRPD
jgi:hypothetical protein